MFLGVAGGTIERSCYSPHYVNTERDYERDYQATLPQGRTAADGCKPRHGRDDRKRERSFSGLRAALVGLVVWRTTAGSVLSAYFQRVGCGLPQVGRMLVQALLFFTGMDFARFYQLRLFFLK